MEPTTAIASAADAKSSTLGEKLAFAKSPCQGIRHVLKPSASPVHPARSKLVHANARHSRTLLLFARPVRTDYTQRMLDFQKTPVFANLADKE
jgi:hypothetical protein